MRPFTVVAVLGLGASVFGYACSSSSTTSSNPDAGSANLDSGSSGDGTSATNGCGLVFFPSDYDKGCQGALDSVCCSEEQTCVGNTDCVKLIACINACPAPRQDACVNACAGDAGESAPGVSQLNDIANCTKGAAYHDPPGVSCAWPSGDGH